MEFIAKGRSRLVIWKPPTSSCTRLQKMPAMASKEAATKSPLRRRAGVRQMTAHAAHPTISNQK